MTLTDILLIAALAVFVLAWWARRMPARRPVLMAAAVVALVVAALGFLSDRWQNGVGGVVAIVCLVVSVVASRKNRLAKTDRASGVPWISGTLIALLTVPALAAIVLFPVNRMPKPSGPHVVGVRAFELADTSRPGVFLAKPDEPRRLLVRVWYPAQSAVGKPAPYFTEAETKSTARALGGFFGFPKLLTYARHVKTNSYPDAPLLAGAADLPVVFYSHGYTSFLHQNTALMETLASHGYVVFSVQHTYDSSATAFLDGTVAPMDPALAAMAKGSEEARSSLADALAGTTPDTRLEGALAYQEHAMRTGDRIVTKSASIWVADRLFLHDTLMDAPPASVADIAAAGNLRRVGQMGMSFGGAVSGELCMIDPRSAAGVNLDGGDFPFSAFHCDVPTPFLMFLADPVYLHRALGLDPPEGEPRGFNEFSYERIGEAGRREDIYRVRLKGAAHLGLSDFSLFIHPLVRGRMLGDAPSDIIIGAQNEFVLGFFDQHLRGAPDDFPARQMAAYESWIQPVPNGDLAAWWNAKPESERTALEARIEALKPGYGAPPAR